MSLWHEIKAMDALLARAFMCEGSAAYEQPVSTGVVADHSHTSHVDAPSSHEGVTIGTVAAHSCEYWDEPFADSLMDDVSAPWLSTQPVRFPTMRVEWGA